MLRFLGGIAATLVHPGEKVVSISGDGGFLFSAMELETAVRLRAPLVHLVWNDGSYDMVAFQQKMKYGKEAAVRFGDVDIVKFAESFGAKGLRVTNPAELSDVLKEALETEGPVVVDIPIDYRDNIKLGETLLPDQFYCKTEEKSFHGTCCPSGKRRRSRCLYFSWKHWCTNVYRIVRHWPY